MDWFAPALDLLSRSPAIGYAPHRTPATEPTALGALALCESGRIEAAEASARRLLDWQAADGSTGVREGEAEPRWPTPLALLAWNVVRRRTDDGALRGRLAAAVERAADWLIACRGRGFARDPQMGHDTTIVAWPWVEGTHSWIEPTALAVLALRSAGRAQDERRVEGMRMLVDRLLPDGGCNYGNTQVLGQTLRPVLLPTGLTLAALSDVRNAPSTLAESVRSDPRIGRSIAYLERSLDRRTPALSLAWCLLGLTAHEARPAEADDWLRARWEREAATGRPNPWTIALLGAARGSVAAWTDFDRDFNRDFDGDVDQEGRRPGEKIGPAAGRAKGGARP